MPQVPQPDERLRQPSDSSIRVPGVMVGDLPDQDVMAVLASAPAAVVSDALDRLGRREQALDGAIRPLWPEARLAGVAVPVVIVADTSEPEQPYDGEMTALDGLRPGDIPMFVVEPGVRAASWGELFSCAAMGRGAAGVVVDGFVRDAAQIQALAFPTFARGLSPLDTFARAVVTGVDVEARVGGVDVRPGDVVVGDRDGIVVVPQEIAADVAEAVVTKHRLEGNARTDLLAGMGIREVWTKYGVL
jgi:4-hydroxy-4-methyl-2-oxoglutarate aldolase